MFCCYRCSEKSAEKCNWDYALRLIFCNVRVCKVFRGHRWHMVESSCKMTTLVYFKTIFQNTIFSSNAIIQFQNQYLWAHAYFSSIVNWGFQDLVSVLADALCCYTLLLYFYVHASHNKLLRCLLKEERRLERVL